MKPNLLLFFLPALLLTASLKAENTNSQKEATEWLLKSAQTLYTNPRQAAYYATKVIDLLPENEVNDVRASALLNYSQAQKLLGDFDSSIKSLYDALECVTFENQDLHGNIYSMMSIMYCSFSDFSKSIEFNDKATSIFKVLNDSLALANCYNDRGIIHCYLHEFTIAEQFLKQSLVLNRSFGNLKRVAANLNNLCLYEGNFDEKINFINEAIIINKNLNSKWSLGENYNNMGRQYYYGKQYNKALEALDTAYEIATAMHAKELISDNYEYRALVYAALNNYKEAYHYQNLLIDLKNELQSSHKLRNIEQEISNSRYIKQKRKAENEAQTYKIELLKRNLFIIIVATLLITVVVFFIWLWYKRKKNIELMTARHELEQTEYKLAEMKMKQQENELRTVNDALDNSRQEASSFAVFLHSRNELLDKIREMIKKGYRMDQQEIVVHLKKINAFISQYQSGDKSNSALLINIEEKNNEFIKRLTERHPDLTNGEKNLAVLLRVNLATKEIAMLTGTTPKTINMNRYRLRKSLNLATEEDLTDYLQNI